MKISDVVATEEVERTCKNMGIRDWSTITKITVSADEARSILQEIEAEGRSVATSTS